MFPPPLFTVRGDCHKRSRRQTYLIGIGFPSSWFNTGFKWPPPPLCCNIVTVGQKAWCKLTIIIMLWKGTFYSWSEQNNEVRSRQIYSTKANTKQTQTHNTNSSINTSATVNLKCRYVSYYYMKDFSCLF